jgi:hypothetical protein
LVLTEWDGLEMRVIAAAMSGRAGARSRCSETARRRLRSQLVAFAAAVITFATTPGAATIERCPALTLVMWA